MLDSSERIEADLVIAGVGVSAAAGFLKGIELHKDGGVTTDKYLRVSEDTYAAGDIAHFPDVRTGENRLIRDSRAAKFSGELEYEQ